MKSFYRKTACLHEKIRLHTCSKIPITCQELKREPPFERGCRGKTLICDRLFASVDRAKRSISASSRTSIYPITINYHTLESIKLSRVTYNNFQHIGHAWGEPMALVLPACCPGALASKLSINPLHSASHHAVNLGFPWINSPVKCSSVIGHVRFSRVVGGEY